MTARLAPLPGAATVAVACGTADTQIQVSGGWSLSSTDLPMPLYVGGELVLVTAMTGARSTAAIINQVATSDILFYSGSELSPGVDRVKEHPEWEQGQFSTFTNPDGTPSYGYYFPNGVSAPSNANYWHQRDARSLSGGSLIWAQIFDADELKNAAQFHRLYDRNGVPLLSYPEFYWSGWFRTLRPLAFTNLIPTGPNAGQFSFTNLTQIKYHVAGVSEAAIDMGFGMNVTSGQTTQRWTGGNRAPSGSFVDLTIINSPPPVPVDEWTHIECRVVQSTGSSGVFQAWQDGLQIVNWSGPTQRTGATTADVSWNLYAAGLTDPSPEMLLDDHAITLTPLHGLINFSGAASNTVLTVTRAINGVSRSHTVGEPVALAEPFRLALGHR